ncbi:hypothetical protein YC2023_122621 [Brassica napus]
MGIGLTEFLSIELATEHPKVIPISVFIVILCLCLVIGHLLEENRWVNESITAILVGAVSGTVILLISKGKSSHILVFDEELFFIYLLPPIIFNAGFQVKKKKFFHNFLTIMSFGVIGGLTARDYLGEILLAAYILHQDETPLLYSLVFGEGVVNDATSVVLFNAVQKIHFESINGLTALRVLGNFLYLFSTSTLLGIGLFSLSGILTVFFCGVLMSHYASYNVTESSRITSRQLHVFAMLSFIAETFIFLYVGTDALDFTKWKTSSLSVGGTLEVSGVITALVLLGRAAFVFPLSVLTNLMNRNAQRSESITFKHQVIIWWAGLMRGAVSIALAFKQFTYSGVTTDPLDAAMVTNTIVVVLFTTLVFGFLTKPLVNYLLPHDESSDNTGNSRGKQSAPGSPKEDATLPLLSFDESTSTNLSRAKDSLTLLIEQPVYTIHRYWRKFDDTYMRPVFGGPRPVNQPEC